MSKRILGLDLGTNSIGWAVVDEVGRGEFELIKRGVHIFQEGVKIEKGNESSKAAERTGYRSARRLKFRRKLRKIETLKVLSEAGYCPALSLEELKAWQSKKVYPTNSDFKEWCRTSDPKNPEVGTFKNPYYFRWLSATTDLDLTKEQDRFKVGRAFYHMAQRRGFKSNRLDGTQESDGVVKKDISELSEKMDGRTLGQYFWEECYQKGAKIRKVHTSRDEHYLAEFESICEKQKIPSELKEKLYRAIFYQRPLKSQKGLVANCPFESQKKRAPISHPLFEEFRMWQTLNSIKIKTMDDAELRPLSQEEKAVILPLFFRVSKAQFDFKDIAKALIKTLNPKKQTHAYVRSRDAESAQVLFNYRDNQSLSGCPFSAKLKNLFGEEYKQHIFENYAGAKQTREGVLKSPEDVLHEVWHVLFSFDDEEKTKEYAQNKLGLEKEKAEKFAKIIPRQGYGALSLKAIRKILPYLKQGLIYSHAVFFANLDQVIGIPARENEKLKADISNLINDHNHYIAQSRCVNEFVRAYKDDPRTFEDSVDLRKLKEFSEKIPSHLADSAEELARLIRIQIRKNNGNGEYLPVKRLDERVGDYLREEFGVFDENLEKLYHPSAIETYKPAERHSDGKYYLGSPRISSIRNPVFMRAMHRLKAVVNELLKQGVITDQTQVHVEMARELNDANKRAAIKTWQRNAEKKRADFKLQIEKDLIAAGITREATADEILKYQLWEEQRRICPYTGNTIVPSEFIGENPKYDIEHTIPRSISCDNSQENKTLCERGYNREIKKNKIPYDCPNYEEILHCIEHWRKEVERLDDLINKKRKASRAATTKEQKDRAIQQRVVLEMDRDYLKGKYRRFTMKEVTSGFKNSQLVDTRIITKYARMYLQTVFSSVHTVNGKTTDDFRRCWGIEKSRDNHAHHTVDAIVVACITRNKYDQLARFYHEYESYESRDPSVPRKPHFSKPWETFTEDMKNLKNEILVSHYAPNHLLKQTKKWVKVRGKRVLQQGKTARGSLHQETFYGAIKRQEKNKKGEVEEVIKYVVRKPLADLSDTDLGKIVDKRIQEIAIEGRKKEKVLKKEIEKLEKKIPRVEDAEEKVLREQIASLRDQLNTLYVLPNKNGNPIPIKKVRIYTKLTNPIPLKKQRDVSEKRSVPYKEKYYVQNDSVYRVALFEGINPSGRQFFESKGFSSLDAVRGKMHIDEVKKNDQVEFRLKYLFQSNRFVLFLKNSSENATDLSNTEISKRLFSIIGLGMTERRVVFRHHLEAREGTAVLKENKDLRGTALPSNVNFENPNPIQRISFSNLQVLQEGIDFKMNVLGEIEFMER